MFRIPSLRLLGAAALAGVAVLATTAASPASADERTAPSSTGGKVYEATNAADGNAVQVFDYTADGTLTPGQLVPTGGLGLGASLGSQGGVVRDGRTLLVVNGGDNTVSSLRITRRGLTLRDVVPSGGVRPVSVTVEDGLVYVLNAGSDTISGLRLDDDGDLRPLSGSTRALSGTGTAAAQVQFAENGRSLVVTERATRLISTFRVGRDGRATGPVLTASAGVTPFGFDIDNRGTVVVSEAGSGSVSSYRLSRGALTPVTAALSDTQAAPCWLEISRDGRFAYTTNAGSGTISSYVVGRDGSLTLLAGIAATTGAGPTDIAQSPDGRFLFARVRDGSIDSFRIGADGALTAIGSAVGATAIGSSGLAAS